MVPPVGLEPTRPRGHRILNPARLPIPPQGHSAEYSFKPLILPVEISPFIPWPFQAGADSPADCGAF